MKKRRALYPSPLDIIERDESVEHFLASIGKAIRTLSYRERVVIEFRFGLGDCESHTLEETAKQFKVTRERVRWIQAKACQKLRNLLKEKGE